MQARDTRFKFVFAFDSGEPIVASGESDDGRKNGDGFVAKPEWGIKRTCQNCGARFYDLQRDSIVCPICETTFDPDRQPRSRRTGGSRPEPAVVAPVTVNKPKSDLAETELVDVDAPDVEAEDTDDAREAGDLEDIDSEQEDLIEDTSDLGQDDDDIGEVIEHIDGDVEDKT